MRNKKTDIQAIQDFYKDDRGHIELTEHQEEKRRRLLMVASMMTKAKSNESIINVLTKDFGISQAQAYRDIRQGVRLYGDIRKAEKEGMRYIIYELALKAYRRALKKGDTKQMNAAVSNMIKLFGLDRESVDIPDFEKIQPSMVFTVLPESVKSQLEGLLSLGAVSLNKMPQPQQIEEIDYDEVEE